MPLASWIPALAVATPLAAVPLILLSARRPNLREGWTLLAAVVQFLLVLTLLPAVLSGAAPHSSVLVISPGIELAFAADPLGLVFALVASGLWIVTSVYSIGYVRSHRERHQTRYFASFAVCLGSAVGVALAANLLSFLISYELLTIATYPLVIHSQSREAVAAGRKYLAFALTAGVLLIAATAWTQALAGSLDFVAGGLLAGVTLDLGTARMLFLLFIAAVGVKAGLMPLHGWLPSAMVAPTPVSALLHAVAVVKSGVFGVLRVVGFVFGPEQLREHQLDLLLALAAGATILLASLRALRQDNLKRRLAYSTIGHLAYIVLGAALLSAHALSGAVLHLTAHATLKITLFFCAGAITVHLHKERVSQLDGIGRDMPWTMGAFAVGSLGLAGIPPLNGFASKWLLCRGAVETSELLALAVLLVSGVLNAAYFFPIVHRAFFRPNPDPERRGEAPLMMVVPICIVAALSLLLGVLPDLGVHFAELASRVSSSVLATPTLAGGLP